MSKKHSKVGSSSNGDGGSAKGYQDESVDALCTAESCFQQKLDKLVDSMLCTLNTTAEVSSIDRSHQEDMQSFATHAYADGVYAGWSLHDRNPAVFHQQPVGVGQSAAPLMGSQSLMTSQRVAPILSGWTPTVNYGISVPSSQDFLRNANPSLSSTAVSQNVASMNQASSSPTTSVNDLPHDPRKCIGCADDDVQEKAFRTIDFLADNFEP